MFVDRGRGCDLTVHRLILLGLNCCVYILHCLGLFTDTVSVYESVYDLHFKVNSFLLFLLKCVDSPRIARDVGTLKKNCFPV
jgi:hypothetical protein